MHEMSVCQALLAQVARIAEERGATAVHRILMELGPLCGVDAGQLQAAFAVMRGGGVASGAELEIEPVGVRVACGACGSETGARANRLICGACGDYRTRLISGDELRLMRVELRVPGPRTTLTA